MNTCPWCGKTTNQSYLKVKDYFLSKEDFELFKCEQCGLLFTEPRPNQNEIGKYYQSEEYYSHQKNKKGFIPQIYESIKAINLKNKVNMAIEGKPNGKLLDIGCGVGDFLVQVKNKGWEIKGIEPSKEAKEIAKERIGFLPLNPSESSIMPDNSFDVITMWHVLEHVEDLKQQTTELFRLLKPEGRLVIALPNYKSYDCEYYKDKWAAWDVPRHLNHFSPTCIQNIMTSVGFKYQDEKKLIWDAYYISFLSEKYMGNTMPLLKGTKIGLKSNRKAKRSGMYSSLVYRFNKP